MIEGKFGIHSAFISLEFRKYIMVYAANMRDKLEIICEQVVWVAKHLTASGENQNNLREV